MLKLFLAQLGIEALVKCIEGCLSWAFFATPTGQAILTKLLESKDFTVTLAVQLLCGPFGSNAHKPAGVQMFNSVYLETRTIVARANPSLEFSSQLVYTLWYLRQPKAAYLLTQFGFTSFEVFQRLTLTCCYRQWNIPKGCFANTARSNT